MADINFTYLPGDGIGPEVGDAAIAVLNAVAQKHGHTLLPEFHLVGGAAIDALGQPLPAETFESCERTGAIWLALALAQRAESLRQYPPLRALPCAHRSRTA